MQDTLQVPEQSAPPSTTDPRYRLTVALAGLGETADAVADRLRELGITGDQVKCWACPVAQLLLTLPGVTFASAGGWTAAVCFGDDSVIVDLPRAIRDFINRFDRGDYSDLIAPLVVSN